MGLFGPPKKRQVPQPDAFKERRSLPRWPVTALAKIRCEGQGEYVDCEIKDLNMRGFSVTIRTQLPQDCRNMILYFNENFFFTIDVTVVWQKEIQGKHVYGLKFTRIRDSDKEKMYQMMRKDFPGHLERYK